MEQKRGMLTDRVQEKAKEVLGYEITQEELRLMPYLQYTMMNDQKLDMEKIAPYESPILSKWIEKEYIKVDDENLGITKQFWDAINEILFLAYVDLSSDNG